MKAQHMSMDRISNLPPNIIESILCLLPIKEAARTSVLSKNWRYNWVTIPKLKIMECDFYDDRNVENQLSLLSRMYESTCKAKNIQVKCRIFYAIYQILLVHRGPIHKFILYMDADKTCAELDQIIHHLSRNYDTLKKLDLGVISDGSYRIPSSIFSFHHLTDLSLHNSVFDCHPTTSNGFSKLTSLYLGDVRITAETLLHLLSICPLLKSFTLFISDDLVMESDSSIFDFLKCLRVIEDLTILEGAIMLFAYDAVQREAPTSLVHLKYLCLDNLCFCLNDGLPIPLLLMRCSPNLEKLELRINEYRDDDYFEIDLSDYSDIWLEHLKEVEVNDFAEVKQEMELVKLILAKSPVLKKVRMVLQRGVTKDTESKILRILSDSPRASPVVKIIAERP